MKILNSKGSALVITLLIITLIFIFSTILIFTVFNSVKQTQVSESQVQATNLAEMAVMYFEEYVTARVKSAEYMAKSILEEDPEATGEQLTQIFCEQFQLTTLSNIPVSTNSNFRARISSVTVDRSDCNQISVKFTSEGTYSGNKKVINGRFYIKNNSTFPDRGNASNLGFPAIPFNYTNTCSSLENCEGKSNVTLTGNSFAYKKSTSTVYGLYLNGNLNMSTNQIDLIIKSGNFYVNGLTSIGNQSTILVQNGNAFFRDITGASNAEIIIYGDVYIFGDVTKFKTSSGNQLLIKATGTVYVADNSDLPNNYRDYCNADKSRGICASAYSTISKSPLNEKSNESDITLSWSLDKPTMAIEYQ